MQQYCHVCSSKSLHFRLCSTSLFVFPSLDLFVVSWRSVNLSGAFSSLWEWKFLYSYERYYVVPFVLFCFNDMEVRFWSSVGNQTYYKIKYEILHSYLISVVVWFLLYHLSLLSWDRDAFRCYQQHNVGRHIFSFCEWIPQVKQCHDRNSLPSQKFAFGFNSERWGWKHEKGLCTVQWYFYWHASLSAWLFGQWASLCVSSRKLNSVTIFSI